MERVGAAVCGWVMGRPSRGNPVAKVSCGGSYGKLDQMVKFWVADHSRDRIRPAPTSATAAMRVQLTSRTTMPKAPVASRTSAAAS
jgi:hypothetical protein